MSFSAISAKTVIEFRTYKYLIINKMNNDTDIITFEY